MPSARKPLAFNFKLLQSDRGARANSRLLHFLNAALPGPFIGDRHSFQWVAYLFAIVTPGITLILRLSLGFAPGDAPVVILFTIPIFLSAYYGGLGPGLTATSISAILSNVFLMKPIGTVHIPEGITGIQWWGLILTGIAISALSEALHHSLRRIHAAGLLQSQTLASIADAVITTDEQGIILFLNSEAEHLSGWSNAEASGQPIGLIFQSMEGPVPSGYDPVQAVLSSGLPANLSQAVLLQRSTDRAILIEYTCSPIRTDGKTTGMVLVFRDISERERSAQVLSAVESTFQALVEQSLAGIYVIQGGRFLYVNPAFALMFGYNSVEEIVGKVRVMDLVQPDDRMAVQSNIDLRLKGEQTGIHYSFRGLKKDGSPIDVEVHGNRATFEGERVVIGLVVDVTEKNALESALRQHQRRLEDLVKERTDDLNQALSEIRKSEERYRVLFSNSKIPMLVIDPVTGRIVDNNIAACFYYGYTDSELKAKTIQEINKLTPEQVDAEMQLAFHEDRNHFYFRHELATGEIRDVEVHSGPLEIGGRKLLYSVVHDITEKRIAERQLKELNRDFLTLLENTSDFIYFKDENSRFRFCSQTLARITGHPKWQEMIGKHDREVFPPEMARIYSEEEIPIFGEGKALRNRVDPYIDENGKRGWVSTSKWPVFGEDGRTVVGLFGISRDVTAQHEAEEKLEIAASVFQSASEGILITDASATIVDANEAFSTITGYSREEILGKNPRLLKSGHHDTAFYTAMWKTLLSSGFWQGEIWNRRKDGGLFACRTAISIVRNRAGEPHRFIGIHSDVTEFLRHHEEIEHMAYYDALTQLPNRALLADRMTQSTAMSDHNKTSVAICYLDLDHFKPVNDAFGHRAGDMLLAETASRLKRCVRAEDTVARLGGDEFVLLLTNLRGTQEWEAVIDRVLESIREPYSLPDGNSVSLSASIGITIYPQDHEAGEQLLKHADEAMYAAKGSGRNQRCVYV